MICHQCGNDFYDKIMITAPDGEVKYKCPYCGWNHKKFHNRGKKKRKK